MGVRLCLETAKAHYSLVRYSAFLLFQEQSFSTSVSQDTRNFALIRGYDPKELPPTHAFKPQTPRKITEEQKYSVWHFFGQKFSEMSHFAHKSCHYSESRGNRYIEIQKNPLQWMNEWMYESINQSINQCSFNKSCQTQLKTAKI